MQSVLRPYFTTGVAIVGASVIAVAPLTIPPAQHGLNVAAAVQHVTDDVQLTALADITGSFDGLVNAALAGIALSLDLQGSVDVNADFATNLANLTGAIIGQITDAFGADPIAGLMDLLMLPVNVVTGLVTGVLGGLTGGTGGIGDLGGLLDLLTAPLGIITDLLGGLTGGTGDLGGLLDLLLTPITVGAQLASVGANLFVNGTAAFVAAFGDVVNGFLNAGQAVLGGLGQGIAGGAALVNTLIGDAVELATDAIGGGAALFEGAVTTGATALGAVVTGFQQALAEFQAAITAGLDVGAGAGVNLKAPADAPLTAFSGQALTDPANVPSLTRTALAPNSTAADAADAAGSLGTPVTVPTPAADTAKAPAVTGAVQASVPGPDRGQTVSEVASSGKAQAGGSTTDGSTSVSGSAHASGKATAKSGTTGGSAHANAHAKK